MIDAWDLFSSFQILIFPTWLITNSWARASASATLAMHGWIRKRLGLFFIQYAYFLASFPGSPESSDRKLGVGPGNEATYFLDVSIAVDGKYRRIRIIRPWAMHLRNPPKKGVGL